MDNSLLLVKLSQEFSDLSMEDIFKFAEEIDYLMPDATTHEKIAELNLALIKVGGLGSFIGKILGKGGASGAAAGAARKASTIDELANQTAARYARTSRTGPTSAGITGAGRRGAAETDAAKRVTEVSNLKKKP